MEPADANLTLGPTPLNNCYKCQKYIHIHGWRSWLSLVLVLVLPDMHEYRPLISLGDADALLFIEVEDVEVALGPNAQREGDDQPTEAELDLGKIKSKQGRQ